MHLMYVNIYSLAHPLHTWLPNHLANSTVTCIVTKRIKKVSNTRYLKYIYVYVLSFNNKKNV